MDRLAADRYARALFQIALEKNDFERYFDQLNAIYEVMTEDIAFMNLLSRADITQDDKIAVIEKVFKNKIYDDILGFFYVILRRNGENDLLNIIQAFITMVKNHLPVLPHTKLKRDDFDLAFVG
jgi:F-type H+-transporting ATPase subunit delta